MPYSITTKDNITIRNIPDDVAPDSQILKDRVATIRSGGVSAGAPKPVSGAAAIPGATPEQLAAAARGAQQAPGEQSLVDKLVGAGETGLTLLTGATGGTLGALGGTVGGLAASVANSEFGTQQGVERVSEAAQKGAAALTYVPRGAAGREMVGDIGELASALPPVLPIAPEITTAARSAPIAQQAAANASQAVNAARTIAPSIPGRIRQAPAQIADRVQRVLNRNPEPKAAGGSVGAAGADIAAQRQAQASNLPAPIDLTLGERTRSPEQLKFEAETAKLPVGQALRERVAENNNKIYQNFDAYIDETGAQATTPRQTGISVDDALAKKAQNAKNEVRVAYKKAHDSAEAQAPVNPDEIVQIGQGDNAIQNSVVGYINSKPAGLNSTKLLDDARKLAVRLGIAELDENGQLIAKPSTVAKMEEFRKEVNGATGYEPSDIRDSTILKGLIDSTNEPHAGPLFQQARRLRENYAKQFEDRSVINKLLTTKRGTSDRNVALEDVFDHAVLKGSLDDVRQVRRVLTAHEANAPEGIVQAGNQAWKDLQGQTVAHIRDRTFKRSATDANGKPVASADGFVKAVAELDKEGKLDYMLGKKGAENMRDFRDVVQLVKTAPPEAAINTSNTAATVLAALGEAGAAGAITGLPVPVLTTLKYLAGRSKDAKLRKKIDQALARASQNKQR